MVKFLRKIIESQFPGIIRTRCVLNIKKFHKILCNSLRGVALTEKRTD